MYVCRHPLAQFHDCVAFSNLPVSSPLTHSEISTPGLLVNFRLMHLKKTAEITVRYLKVSCLIICCSWPSLKATKLITADGMLNYHKSSPAPSHYLNEKSNDDNDRHHHQHHEPHQRQEQLCVLPHPSIYIYIQYHDVSSN